MDLSLSKPRHNSQRLRQASSLRAQAQSAFRYTRRQGAG